MRTNKERRRAMPLLAPTPSLLFAPALVHGEHHNGTSQTASTTESTMIPAASSAQLPPPAEKELSGFFAIGIVVNIALLAAFLLWAVKQWK